VKLDGYKDPTFAKDHPILVGIKALAPTAEDQETFDRIITSIVGLEALLDRFLERQAVQDREFHDRMDRLLRTSIQVSYPSYLAYLDGI